MRTRDLMLAAVTVFLAACTRQPVIRSYEGPRVIIEQNIAAGCYDCLSEARQAYASQTDAPDQDLVVTRTFELDLLIAMRERELGLDWTVSLKRAGDLLDDLPPEVNGARLIALVNASPLDQFAYDAATQFAATQQRQEFQMARTNELAWVREAPMHPILREYFIATFDCRTAPSAGAIVPPIIQYKRGTCGVTDARALARVKVAVPRFVEVAYYLAQGDVLTAERTGGVGADTLLQQVYSRFRNSSGVTYLRGMLSRVTDECTIAIGHFDETIALQPRHEQAMLGRTMCLTDLKRNNAALQSATQMIDMRVPILDQAYYWRALNHRALGDLASARADMEQAKAIQRTEAVLTMAGIIEFEQQEYQTAELDLREATNPENCTAAWYLGRTLSAVQRFEDAALNFEASMSCCALVGTQLSNVVQSLRADQDIAPAYKARRLANFENRIRENRSQQYAAAFNAANFYFRAGKKTRSMELLEIAAQDSSIADQVAILRAALGGEIWR